MDSIPKIIRKTVMKPVIMEFCPLCGRQILEKSLYLPDINDPDRWIHRACGGAIALATQNIKDIIGNPGER